MRRSFPLERRHRCRTLPRRGCLPRRLTLRALRRAGAPVRRGGRRARSATRTCRRRHRRRGLVGGEALARSGVGALTLIDLDHVAESNINRQIHALDSTIGQAKVLAMRERIAQINPECTVHAIEEFVEPGNWPRRCRERRGRGHRRLRPGAGQGCHGGLGARTRRCSSPAARPAASGWRTRSTSTTCRSTPRTTRCWRSCASACASSMARRGGQEDRRRLRLQPRGVAPPDASCAIEGDGSLNCHGYGSVVSVTATFGQCARQVGCSIASRPAKAAKTRYNRGLCCSQRQEQKNGSGTLAQLVEQRTFNPLVTGSNPVRPTTGVTASGVALWVASEADYGRAASPSRAGHGGRHLRHALHRHGGARHVAGHRLAHAGRAAVAA
jgi:hypothetical protein